MPYYNKCPYCHSNLDPGEKCECREERKNDAYTKDTACSNADVGYMVHMQFSTGADAGGKTMRIGVIDVEKAKRKSLQTMHSQSKDNFNESIKFYYRNEGLSRC